MDTYEAKMKVKIIKANKIKSEWKVYKFRQKVNKFFHYWEFIKGKIFRVLKRIRRMLFVRKM